LCAWIDEHLEETIGWQQLFENSGLEHHALQMKFFKHADTTPMTWIRGRREAKAPGGAKGGSILTLKQCK
jgi:methylphosphotriester-DNA--protein-cysteine methyltransferase